MKKVFALVMAAVMVLGMFAGCASKKDSAGTIKVGAIGPLTGDYAIYGSAVANGIQIAIDEINAKGGLQFELLSEDDQGDPTSAVNAYNGNGKGHAGSSGHHHLRRLRSCCGCCQRGAGVHADSLRLQPRCQ